MEISPALLLRKTRFSETSLIVTWFTLGHGKLKTVAKGALRPKSGFAGKLDLFFEAEIQFARSHKSELHTLKELALIETNEAIRSNYRKVLMSAYFCELIEQVTELEHPAPELYDLLQRAFRYMQTGEPTLKALTHFESETVRLLGIENRSVTAAIALGRSYGRLPKGRPELINLLK